MASTDIALRGNQGALVAREEFGGTELAHVLETSANAIAARETALVQSRFVMAMKRPRDLENVRVKMLKACDIWAFADESWYSRPAGREKNEETGQWETKYAEGFSIRFAEEAGRVMGNIMSDSQIVAEMPEERIVHIWAMDLETNFTRGVSVSVPKTMERRSLKKDQVALAQRVNSQGETTYIVAADSNSLNTTQANLCAKAERQCILKLIPAWILRECKDRIAKTLAAEIEKDPDAAWRRLIDAFAELKIMPSDLLAYVGHALDRISPKEIEELRGVYRSIANGESTWDEIMSLKGQAGSSDASAEVAKKKLAELRKSSAPADRTPEKGDIKPEERKQPDPAKIDEEHQLQLLQLAESLGITQETLKQIVDQRGFKALHTITEDKYAAIVQDLKDVAAHKNEPAEDRTPEPGAADQAAGTETEKPKQKLTFGKRPEGK